MQILDHDVKVLFCLQRKIIIKITIKIIITIIIKIKFSEQLRQKKFDWLWGKNCFLQTLLLRKTIDIANIKIIFLIVPLYNFNNMKPSKEKH